MINTFRISVGILPVTCGCYTKHFRVRGVLRQDSRDIVLGRVIVCVIYYEERYTPSYRNRLDISA